MPTASMSAFSASKARLPAHPLARWDRAVWVFMILGTLLRVMWPLDMEWKFDEKWMFAKGVAIAQGRDAWPWVGMPSGVGMRNPGMSIWPFALIAYVADTPIGMNTVIQWLNALGLWAFALWVHKTWPKEHRALGMWGLALYAVTPLAVLFSRKIWAQDVLVLLVVPWLWGHRARQSWWGAGAWGLCGALLGQIHMSGFFAAAALLLVTCAQDRLRWSVGGWLVGSVLGSLTLLPWIQYVLSPESRGASQAGFSPAYFIQALRHAWGLSLEYPLGRSYHTLLRGPLIAGIETQLAQLARYGLLLLLTWGLIARALDGKQLLRLPEVVYTYAGCAACTGLLMIAARVQVYEHYLIVLGPMLHITAAWLLFKRRAAVLLLCTLQAFLTVCFMLFIHARGGAAEADYGKTYRTQTAEERALPTSP